MLALPLQSVTGNVAVCECARVYGDDLFPVMCIPSKNATLQPPVSYGLWKSLSCLCLHDNQKPHTTTVLLNHLWGLTF